MRQQSIGRCAVADRKDRGALRAVNKALNERRVAQSGTTTMKEIMHQSAILNAAKKAAWQRSREKLNTTSGMFGTTVKPDAP